MSAQKMIKENIKEDLSISVMKANLYAVLTSLPFILLFSINYIYMWGVESFSKGFIIFNFRYFLPVILIGIPIHEIIHWIVLIIGKKSAKKVKFGFHIKFYPLMFIVKNLLLCNFIVLLLLCQE